MLGAFWYLISIERETTCWQEACGRNTTCNHNTLYCNSISQSFNTFLNSSCPIQEKDPPFDFGIFLDALQSGIVESSTDFPQKFFYCFWWGLRNLRCGEIRIIFFYPERFPRNYFLLFYCMHMLVHAKIMVCLLSDKYRI